MTIMGPGSQGDDVRSRLAIALDVDDLVAAVRLARRMRPYFGVAKVGLELFAAAGAEAISALTVEGYRVFVDLKLHDIPNTVGSASKVLGALGVSYATVHLAGGLAMVAAATEAMTAGAASAGAPEPCVLGVTVLTSAPEAPADVLAARLEVAKAGGCGGIVCAAGDLGVVRRINPQLLAVVPGIRMPGARQDDQARTATPGEAIRAGAGMIVIGRAVSRAGDPEAVAGLIFADVSDALRQAQPVAGGAAGPEA